LQGIERLAQHSHDYLATLIRFAGAPTEGCGAVGCSKLLVPATQQVVQRRRLAEKPREAEGYDADSFSWRVGRHAKWAIPPYEIQGESDTADSECFSKLCVYVQKLLRAPFAGEAFDLGLQLRAHGAHLEMNSKRTIEADL